MSDFRRGYQAALDHFFGDTVGQRVAQYGDRVEASVAELIRDMEKVAMNEKGLDYVKGDVAELWHAGTLNLDAVRRGIDVEAFAPRNASPIDIALRADGYGLAAQLKFYRSADATAKAISDPKYQDLEKVVPADQLRDVREAALRLADRNVERPDVAASYDHTARVVDDRLRIDGAESRPLTEEQSRILTQQFRQDGGIDQVRFGLTSQELIEWHEVFRDATSAAVRAALITAALQAAPYLVAIARKGIETGAITAKDFAPLGRAVPATMLRSGLAGGLAAAIVGAARKELLGASLKDLDPSLVSAVVVLSLCAVTNSIKAARGELTPQEAAGYTAEDALTIAVALGFGAIGQALIPIPLLGSLIGNIVGALVARLVIDQASAAMLSLAVETGWTFFGLVDQNYTVPAELLSEAGWKMIELRKLGPRPVELRGLEPRTMYPDQIDVTVLRRGVVAFRRVGYVA
ncbi:MULTISPECIES: hypothetical protein [unclassified Agromyces]|uniref:hypothetical protein n=1 Tax=unclassified Agromyces TaxID=2639701 RepID=UPI00301537B1